MLQTEMYCYILKVFCEKLQVAMAYLHSRRLEAFTEVG